MTSMPTAAMPAAELLSVREVAALLSCSPRHVARLSDSRRMPAPIKLGALSRWRTREITNWLDEGAPAVRAMRGGAG